MLRRKKKQIEKENKAKKELESLNSGEKLHQSANKSGNTSKNHKNHASALKAQIDLNFQPEKDEDSLPGCNATNENNSLHHDDASFTPAPSSSSSPHSLIDTQDEGNLGKSSPVYLALVASLGEIEVALANTKPSSL